MENKVFTIHCPFCAYGTTAANNEFGISVVKELTGKHLARFHREEIRNITRARLKRGEAVRGRLLHA